MENLSSGSKPNDFQFDGVPSLLKNPFHLHHHQILNQVFATILTLENGKVLNDNNSSFGHFKREIGLHWFKLRTANMAFHMDFLVSC
jgi:hypothetical protein